MAHDVFISYANQDKTVADAVCATLEANGIRCWIAPRDVMPGMNWAASIIDALHSARVVVLVFSENSNKSSQVAREVERAANREMPIIPFRIENVLPSDAMEYFLGTPHWLDAMSPPLERHLQQLVTTVRALLIRAAPVPVPAPDPMPQPTPIPQPTPVPQPDPAPQPGPAPHVSWLTPLLARLNSSPYRWLFAGGAACFAALVVVVMILALRPQSKPLTPQQIYAGLLNVAPTQLPPGITLDEISSHSIETGEAKHNAIGEVIMLLKSGNLPALPNDPDNDYIIYIVFPTDDDARARFSEYSLSFPVPGVKESSKCFNGTDTDNNTKVGYTACVVQSGSVLAYAESEIAGDQQQQGSPSESETLARFALTHLDTVKATSPSAISAANTGGTSGTTGASGAASATPTPTASPTVVPTAVVTPVAALPRNISLVYEDLQSRSRAAEANRDVSTIFAHFQVDYGLDPTRPLVYHFFSDKSTASPKMSQLGVPDSAIQDLISGNLAAEVVSNTNTVDAVIFLPSATDLQQSLAFCLSSYTLRLRGAFVNDDVYPYWFLRGFETYNQSRFTDQNFSLIPTAQQDGKAGNAPALSTISSNDDAQSFINDQNNGSNRLDARGEAAVQYLAARFGNAAVAHLLRDGPFNSITDFNADLQTITQLTLPQFNAAVDTYLRSLPS